MNRRKMIFILAAFLLGISVIRYRTWYAAALVLPVLVLMLLICRRKEVMLSFLILICFGAGAFRYYQEVEFRKNYESILQDNQEISLQGTLYKKEQKAGQSAAYIKKCVIQLNQKTYLCNPILVYLDTGEYQIGETITAKAKVKLWKTSRNDGNFDEKVYYQSQKIDFRAEILAVTGIYGKKDRLAETLYNLKLRMMKCYGANLNAKEAGVMDAIVLGEKASLDPSVKELYQDAGISHILAISGLHISMIGMGCFGKMRNLKCSYPVAAFVSLLVLYLFGTMSGMGISTKRAVGMFFLLMMANLIGRSYDSLSALAFVALLLLNDNPFLIENSGFLFSVSAVFAAGAYQENTKLSGWKNTAAMSLVIQLVTIPLLAQYYHTIAIYTVLVNLLILPLVGVLLVFGIFGGITGIWIPLAAPVCLYPCHLILWFYEKVCEMANLLPGGKQILGCLNGYRLVAYLLCLSLWLIILLSPAVENKKINGRSFLPVLLLVLVLIPSKERFEIDILDVGQGDGIYIQTEEGIHMVIDGGSTDVSQVGKYRILPFLEYHGVKKIDYWFVTHLDEDHCSGLKEMLKEGYQVDYIVLSSAVYQDEAFLAFESMAKEHSNLVYMKKGDSIGIGTLKLTCLFPDRAYGIPDRNAKSMVLYLQKEGFSALFTGDIGQEQEERLLSMWKGEKLNLYKAAHHGSRYSNGEEILSATKPEIAVISCARQNHYGHPGKETIARMKQVQSRIYYTMYSGQIKITREKDKTIVEKKVKE